MTTVDLQIPDNPEHLAMLAEAAQECGLEFMVGQQTHRWFGQFVGDTKPPKNMDPKKYGTCEHALRVKDGSPRTYEIGLVRDTQTGNLVFAYDYWMGGYGLVEKIGGNDAVTLRNLYCEKVANAQMRDLERQGWRIQRFEENGKIRHRATR